MANSACHLLRFVSYNSRGINVTKQAYLRRVLADCDVLMLQEHWLSEDQLSSLNTLSIDHLAVAVSGFGNESVLNGRPYGGCAILWRKTLSVTVTPVTTYSRRVCAVRLCINDLSLLCICVYMPYEKDSSSVEYCG